MPPATILDLGTIDLNRVVVTRDEIYKVLPHRYEFMMLDGIVHVDRKAKIAVGYREIREDEWWVRGHIPGRPLFPGVLMVETAAHLASYVASFVVENNKFLGFGGIDETKFRESISPPTRLYIVGQATQINPRRVVCATQGFVEGRMVFQSLITGMFI